MYNEYGFYPDTKPLSRNDKAPLAGNYSYFFIKPQTNDWGELVQIEKEAGKHGAVLALPTSKGVLISIANSDDQHFRDVYKDMETEDITKNVGDLQSKHFNASIEYILNNLNMDETKYLKFEMNKVHLNYNEEEARKFRREKLEKDLQKLKQQHEQIKEQEKEETIATPLFDNAVENIRVHDEVDRQKELSQKAELDVWIEKAEKDNKLIVELRETVEKQNQLLYGNISIEVNGKIRNFPNGLVHGTSKCIEKLDEANQKIEKLNSIIQFQQKSINISPKSQSDDGIHSY